MPRLFEERRVDPRPDLARPSRSPTGSPSTSAATAATWCCSTAAAGTPRATSSPGCPGSRILFAGDLVEAQAALYTGDAFHRDWSTGTLDRGRGVRRRGAGRRPRRGRRAAGRRSTPRSRRPATSSHVMLARGRRRAARAAARSRRRSRPRTPRWPTQFGALADLRALPAVRRLAAVGRARRRRAAADLDRRARPRGLGAAAGHDVAWIRTGPPVLVVGAGPGRADRRRCCSPAGGCRRSCSTRRPARDLVGSKAICQQRDVLDIWDAVGAGEQIADEGVTWTTARTFYRDRELFAHRPSSTPGARRSRRSSTSPRPAPRRSSTSASPPQPLIDVRWGHEVIGARPGRRRGHR